MGISLPGLSLEGTLFLEKDTILCQCVEPAWHSRENRVCSIFSLRTLSSLLASEADAVVFRAESKGKCFKKILKINYLSGKVKSSVYLFAKRTTKSLKNGCWWSSGEGEYSPWVNSFADICDLEQNVTAWEGKLDLDFIYFPYVSSLVSS